MACNPYVQVALTYVRRPFSSWQLGSILGLTLLNLVLVSSILISSGRAEVDHASVMLSLVAFAVLLVCLVIHVKDQFADSRAHWMPGFRRVHATIACVMALVVTVLLPGLWSLWSGWNAIGFVALTVLLFATVLCVLLTLSPWAILFAIAGWFLLWTTPWQDHAQQMSYVQQLLSGEIEMQALLLLAIGAAITLFCGVRLFRLTEDMPEYRWMKWNHTTGSLQKWDNPTAIRDPLARFLRRVRDGNTQQKITRLNHHARRASTSYWSRICRWQLGMVAGWQLLFWMVATVLNFQLLTWLLGCITPSASLQTQIAGMLFWLLAVIPLQAVTVTMTRRLPSLQHELLLPVDRKSYVRQFGMAAAFSQFQLWCGVVVVFVVWLLLVCPQSVPPAMLAIMLTTSAAIQIGSFGIVAWISRYRSTLPVALGSAPMIVFTAFTYEQNRLSDAWRAFETQSTTLPERHTAALATFSGVFHEQLWIAGGIALAGLLFTFDAYRRWLKTDVNESAFRTTR
jgi:hypothetical protein